MSERSKNNNKNSEERQIISCNKSARGKMSKTNPASKSLRMPDPKIKIRKNAPYKGMLNINNDKLRIFRHLECMSSLPNRVK